MKYLWLIPIITCYAMLWYQLRINKEAERLLDKCKKYLLESQKEEHGDER